MSDLHKRVDILMKKCSSMRGIKVLVKLAHEVTEEERARYFDLENIDILVSIDWGYEQIT